MTLTRRSALRLAAAATVPLIRPARAQAPPIKIGILNDQSGPYTNTGGITSVICAKQALEDFGVSTKGMNVEVSPPITRTSRTSRCPSPASGSTATASMC